MANPDHIAQLMKGVAAWNAWRAENPSGAYGGWADLGRVDLREAKLMEANLSGANLSEADLRDADLSEADLSKADLSKAKLVGADLRGAKLMEANLIEANFSEAHLFKADLSGANLYKTHLSGANLIEANLDGANLMEANLSRANLSRADLPTAILVGTNFSGADLTACRIYGVSAWDLKLKGAKQQNLVITRDKEQEISVDNIEVAQFIYLLLHNEKIRDVIDTIGKKGVLLLGRFTEGRIQILERLREKLRSLGFVPMVFNFDKPETKDFTGTVRLLANLSRFVIVDITKPRSTPLELQATVPDYMVPFAPILQEGEQPFAMFLDLQNMYDWVLKPIIVYSSVDRLIEVFEEEIVRPAEAKFD